jgi:hypothetical protein
MTITADGETLGDVDGLTEEVGEVEAVGDAEAVGDVEAVGEALVRGVGVTTRKSFIPVAPLIVLTPGFAKLGITAFPAKRLTVPVGDTRTILELADVNVAIVQVPLHT